jgi:hypothetical protein
MTSLSVLILLTAAGQRKNAPQYIRAGQVRAKRWPLIGRAQHGMRPAKEA